MAKIYLKRRIEKFFTDEDGEVVFALYEDVDGHVHFYYLNRPHERDKKCECHFFKEYRHLVEDGQIE